MNDWALLSQRRADVYEWFAGVFALELAESAIAAYQQGAVAPLLAAFDTMGLGEESRRVAAAVAAWAGIADLRVELAADFARLFLFDGRDTAVPYASAYLDPEGQLYGAPQAQMQQFLRETGLQVHAGFKEPADHLAVALACLGKRLRDQATAPEAGHPALMAEQAGFLNQAVLSWLPQFDARCRALREQLASDFYPAMASLLLAFVRADAATLESADAFP